MNPRPIDPAQIIEEVAHYFHLTVEELKSESRKARLVWPRQVAMHLLKEMTLLSNSEIGRQLGDRDHSTVIFGRNQTAEKIAEKPELGLQVEAIAHAIRTAHDQSSEYSVTSVTSGLDSAGAGA